MDHSSANIIEFPAEPHAIKTIESKFTHDVKTESLNKGEWLMHKKENHQQTEYYAKLGEIIRNYHEVVLFGPTDAKSELLNILKKNHLFADINIKLEQTDKLTYDQQYVFVQEYFSKPHEIQVEV